MKWVKHDTDANQDAKLQNVLLDYGLEGYGLYWYCIELIAGKVDKDNITFELEHDARIIARNTGSTAQRVEELMRYFVKQGLFENSSGVITCMKLAKRLDKSMTSNPEMRQIIDGLKNNDSVMTPSENVMQDKIRLEENRKDSSRSAIAESAQHVVDIYHDTIDKLTPSWSKTRSLTDKRKRMANKSLSVVRERATAIGLSPLEYLENLLSAMAQDPFYSGTQPSRDKPNGYQWTIDQVLRADILAQAIDRLSGD